MAFTGPVFEYDETVVHLMVGSMVRSSFWSRRVTRWLLNPLEAAIVAVVNVFVLFRLGNMQLEGMATAIGAVLALLAATTSLLFNRARAYPAGAVQRRSLLAAELSLRATFAAAFGAVITAIIFPMLQSSGYAPTPINEYPTQWVPMFMAFVPTLFFMTASLLLLAVGRVLVPSLLSLFKARDVRRATRS